MRQLRFSFILLLLLLVSSLMAAPLKENDIELDSLSEIQGRGEIIIAVEKDSFPWSYRDSKKRLNGYSIEVAKHIAEELGSSARFVEVDFIKLWSGLEDDSYDMAINIHSNFNVAEGQENPFDSTYKYFPVKGAVVVREDNTDITSTNDLWDNYVATPVDPVYIKLANRYNALCIGIKDAGEMFSLVENGTVAASICPIETITKYLSENKNAPFKIVAATKEVGDALSFPIKKGEGSKDLKRSVNKAILKLRRKGILSELSIKHFGYDFFSTTTDNEQ